MISKTRSEVADRVTDLRRCEKAVSDAEGAIIVARDELDQALAKRLWTRLHGAFGPGVRLYENVMHPGATVELTAVLRAIAAEDQR